MLTDVTSAPIGTANGQASDGSLQPSHHLEGRGILSAGRRRSRRRPGGRNTWEEERGDEAQATRARTPEPNPGGEGQQDTPPARGRESARTRRHHFGPEPKLHRPPPGLQSHRKEGRKSSSSGCSSCTACWGIRSPSKGGSYLLLVVVVPPPPLVSIICQLPLQRCSSSFSSAGARLSAFRDAHRRDKETKRLSTGSREEIWTESQRRCCQGGRGARRGCMCGGSAPPSGCCCRRRSRLLAPPESLKFKHSPAGCRKMGSGRRAGGPHLPSAPPPTLSGGRGGFSSRVSGGWEWSWRGHTQELPP
ncbi:uncharacterized protein LOC128408349 [Podarcis raffonei]|uniref:uncharacterized protein LOC128408349 n=1 Tax=Podarcis raffonei TaxID=65483 RepID=UPI0023299396|nr:uncharacterized protein LOC128408349 [Podarcis raffonei]